MACNAHLPGPVARRTCSLSPDAESLLTKAVETLARAMDTVIREIFARMDEFRAAGVEGMIWRMLADDPRLLSKYMDLIKRRQTIDDLVALEI